MSQTKSVLLALASFVVFGAIVIAIMASVTDDVGVVAIGPLIILAMSSYGVYRTARGGAPS